MPEQLKEFQLAQALSLITRQDVFAASRSLKSTRRVQIEV